MAQHSVRKMLIETVVSALAAVFALLCAMSAFGWFSFSKNVTGNGISVQSKENQTLQIRATAIGEDIGVSEVTKDMDKLSNDGNTDALYPGASGSFSFYVHDGSAVRTYPYSFHYSVYVENNQFYEGADYPNGFYPYSSEEERAQAKQYINSHLLFFTHKEDGEYSGWIRPDAPTLCIADATGDDSAYEVKVYWVWVDIYNRIFEENSGLIAEPTRIEIATYFDNEANIGKIVADGEKSSEAYNTADTLIGVTLKHICFEIDVTKD